MTISEPRLSALATFCARGLGSEAVNADASAAPASFVAPPGLEE